MKKSKTTTIKDINEHIVRCSLDKAITNQIIDGLLTKLCVNDKGVYEKTNHQYRITDEAKDYIPIWECKKCGDRVISM